MLPGPAVPAPRPGLFAPDTTMPSAARNRFDERRLHSGTKGSFRRRQFMAAPRAAASTLSAWRSDYRRHRRLIRL